ncbi:MAG: sulfite exporter TauE/SafE family protein [Candidatus Omnitrophica bacterium]|nr:sulfite exporter TauE/SafE family protein [Candidatus Omnitrophota bacterium]
MNLAISSFITYLQIFGIGFSFGLAGPCLLTCAPILIAYIAGNRRSQAGVLKDIFMFLSGRLSAYLLLGALAGLSGTALRKFTGSSVSSYLHPLAGAVTILFAVILFTGKSGVSCSGIPTVHGKMLNFGGIFVFGFLIGISPCAPLLALLFDIAIMSKGLLDGVFYTLFFGLGTFLSGLITIGVVTGILTRVPAAFVKSKTAAIIFKTVCALLLLALGLGMILKSYIRI